MEIIKKILGIKKIIFHYIKPDVSKRHMKGIGNHGAIRSRSMLYNQNLTVDELCLLRNLIWDYKEHVKSSPNRYGNHESWDERHFTDFIHTWLFTDKKDITRYDDIIQDIEEGVSFEGKLP